MWAERFCRPGQAPGIGRKFGSASEADRQTWLDDRVTYV